MTEYPKMLYSGDTVNYSCRVVHTPEEEAQFREIGLVDYADLPEPEPKIEEPAPSEAPQGFVTTEQFDAVAERLAAAEQEIERLKNPEPFVPETQSNSIDYSAMSNEQLRAVLDEKGIKYLARDSKAELLGLLAQPKTDG